MTQDQRMHASVDQQTHDFVPQTVVVLMQLRPHLDQVSLLEENGLQLNANIVSSRKDKHDERTTGRMPAGLAGAAAGCDAPEYRDAPVYGSI